MELFSGDLVGINTDENIDVAAQASETGEENDAEN